MNDSSSVTMPKPNNGHVPNHKLPFNAGKLLWSAGYRRFKRRIDELYMDGWAHGPQSIMKLAQIASTAYDSRRKSKYRQFMALSRLEQACATTYDVSGSNFAEYAKAFQYIVEKTSSSSFQRDIQERASRDLRAMATVELKSEQLNFLQAYCDICVRIATLPPHKFNGYALNLSFRIPSLAPIIEIIPSTVAHNAAAAVFEIIGTPEEFYYGGKVRLGKETNLRFTEQRKMLAVNSLAKICLNSEVDGIYEFAAALLEKIGCRDKNMGLKVISGVLVETMKQRDMPTFNSQVRQILRNIYEYWSNDEKTGEPELEKFISDFGQYMASEGVSVTQPPLL